MVTPGFILVFWLLSSTVVVAARLAARYTLGRLRLHGRNLRHVLILGTNGRAVEFARKIEGNPELGYRILGFVDEDWSGRQDFLKTGYSLCCDFDGLPEFLRRNVIDEVAMYLPVRSFYEFTSKVAALCELHGIKMRFATDIFNFKIARAYADDIGGGAHITAHSGSPDSFGLFLKRVLDVLVSFGLLVCLAPLLAITALLVKLTSEGPILYMQERVGLGKRRFRIFKFRTMVVDADKMLAKLESLNEMGGPVFKIKNDPRMTSLGRFLRKTSIDELPQLFNVLKGDMSLVGPRPLPVRDYEGFNEDWQRRRFSIRPGITCLWQVNGRNSITFEKWMELDLQYMDEWSLWLDIRILARTVPAVLKGSGAV
jgi:exopolysaccharide biosynthesis polyprenyl glycosylphosphotransferase